MTTHPPLLHVSEQAWRDVRARAAFVHVTLTADKLFSGRAALAKAVELRRLVTALAERDIPDDAIGLEGAALDVSSGLFTRSSSVTYRLRIHVKEVDRIADVLDAIADAKQATLTHIEWDYAGASVEELLADCATRALGKAKRLATALGVTLDGVHEVHEEQLDDHGRPQPMAAHAPMMAVRAKRTVASELAGLELAPTKKLGARVRIAYRIGSNLR